MKEAKLHITDEEMQSYIKNQLPAHHRQRVELEIQLCETCLESFIHWNSRIQLAYLPQSEQAAQQILDSIEAQRTKPKRNWIQHPFAQIAIAASITLLLVGSGAMTMISSSLAQIEESGMQPPSEHLIQRDAEQATDLEQANSNDAPSNSEKWLDKATDWIEKLKASRFE